MVHRRTSLHEKNQKALIDADLCLENGGDHLSQMRCEKDVQNDAPGMSVGDVNQTNYVDSINDGLVIEMEAPTTDGAQSLSFSLTN